MISSFYSCFFFQQFPRSIFFSHISVSPSFCSCFSLSFFSLLASCYMEKALWPPVCLEVHFFLSQPFSLGSEAVVHSETNGNQVHCHSHSAVPCSAQQLLSRSTLKDNRVSYTTASLPTSLFNPICSVHTTSDTKALQLPDTPLERCYILINDNFGGQCAPFKPLKKFRIAVVKASVPELDGGFQKTSVFLFQGSGSQLACSKKYELLWFRGIYIYIYIDFFTTNCSLYLNLIFGIYFIMY